MNAITRRQHNWQIGATALMAGYGRVNHTGQPCGYISDRNPIGIVDF